MKGGAIAHENKVGKGSERVMPLDGGERLQQEVATVTGEADPEGHVVAGRDPLHLSP